MNWAADMAELGMSAATTVVGGAATKAAIGAVLTGFKGARLSAEKNFFREKSTEVVVAAMQAERSKKLALILQKMDQGVDRYPFEDAAVDLVEFFYVGTVEGALQNLVIETGERAKTEKAALHTVQVVRARIAAVSAAELKLTQDMQIRMNEIMVAKNILAAQAVLKKLGVTVADNQAIEQLLTEFRKTPYDAAYRLKFRDALFPQ